jgi:hypothetical protein
MYSRQEASQLRKNFWTSFGQYMRPIRGAGDVPVNWLNYKTGIKHLYFRMDADHNRATIAIEFRHPDRLLRQNYFIKFQQVEKLFHQTTEGIGNGSYKQRMNMERRLVVSALS